LIYGQYSVGRVWRMLYVHAAKVSRSGKFWFIEKATMVSRFVCHLRVCLSRCRSFISCSLTYPLTIQQLIYEKLPNDISDRHVLLLDPILGTGLSFS
jgi:hypothetical protein